MHEIFLKSKVKIFKVSIGVLLAFVLCYFLFRNMVLESILEKKLNTYSKRFNCEIKVDGAKLKGLSSFYATQISIKPNQADTLLVIKNLETKISFFKLLLGSVRLKTLSCDAFYLNVFKQGDTTNYASFIQKKAENDSLPKDSIIKVSKKKSTNYAGIVKSVFTKLFDNLPNEINLKQIVIKTKIDNSYSLAVVPYFILEGENFNTAIYGFENGERSAWKCFGSIDESDNKLFVSLNSFNDKKYQKKIPILGTSLGLTIGADTLSFAIAEADLSSDESKLKGYVTSTNLLINHKRISPEDVTIKRGVFNFALNITPTALQLDSSSSAVLNNILLSTYFNFDNKNSKKIALKVKMRETESQEFFESLPQGLFQNFKGIQTKGKLSYNLNFAIDLSDPDSVEFTSKLEKSGFKVLKYGETNFSKINGEFHYTAYEKGNPVRSFLVGSSNPNYTPISEISQYLKSALMTSEDGNFYYHGGFNEGAFRQSIATNIKEKRFARGGSTISMQLVKNVFLTRNKTVARKIEEALIVWLIESNRLVGKERMYEVYLNIIEWGPGVYGIGEASRFYFDKSPSTLTLEESIFLASIVPRPKAFRYSFDEAGNLKPHLEGYYKLLGNHLWAKGVISEAQKVSLFPAVELKGTAKSLVIKPDTSKILIELPIESVEY